RNNFVYFMVAETGADYDITLPSGWLASDIQGFKGNGAVYASGYKDAEQTPYQRRLFKLTAEDILFATSERLEWTGRDVPKLCLGDDVRAYALLYDEGSLILVKLDLEEVVPEPTQEPTAAPTETPEPEPIYTVSTRSHYLRTAHDALGSADWLNYGNFGEFDTRVAFGFGGDSFIAYEKYALINENGEARYLYADPIAVLPAELGVRAQASIADHLRNEANIDVSDESALQLFGYLGDDYIIFVDAERLSNLAAHAVFYTPDGENWVELGGFRDYPRPVTGGCVVSENEAYLCFDDSDLQQSEGYTTRRLTVYRTTDGGQTWRDIGLEIPAEYENDNWTVEPPAAALSPVFEGEHGVIIAVFRRTEDYGDGETDLIDRNGIDDICVFETTDGGESWEPVSRASTVNLGDEHPDEEWCLEQCWQYAEFANQVHGYHFSRDRYEYRHYSFDSQCYFIFSTEENDQLYCVFGPSWKKGVWHFEYNDIYTEPMSEEEWARIAEQYKPYAACEEELSISARNINVSRAELEAAGYILNGDELTDENFAIIAQYRADQIVARFVNAPEDNFLRCYEAYAVNPRVEHHWVSNSEVSVFFSFATRPVEPRMFSIRFGDIGCGVLGEDAGEYAGWFSFGFQVMVHVEQDGSFTMSTGSIGG
ncbi:MAG: hypothetical protein IK064_01435, partial [Clostridia bacterium]|nr:hypothetical protein [Clostridia bacterium]